MKKTIYADIMASYCSNKIKFIILLFFCLTIRVESSPVLHPVCVRACVRVMDYTISVPRLTDSE